MRNNWKGILIIAIIITPYFILDSCIKEKKEVKKVLTEKEIEDEKYLLVDFELESNKEKILLLSFIKNIPKDSINIILRDYLIETENNDFFEESVKKIAKKHLVSSNKIASIVFSYKYEALSEDEFENKVTDRISEISEESENYNRGY